MGTLYKIVSICAQGIISTSGIACVRVCICLNVHIRACAFMCTCEYVCVFFVFFLIPSNYETYNSGEKNLLRLSFYWVCSWL